MKMFVYFGSDSLGRNSNDFHYQKKTQNKKETETATSKQENISLVCWLNSRAQRRKKSRSLLCILVTRTYILQVKQAFVMEVGL